MADVAHAEDVIEPEEREFIHSIIEFGDTVVREVMVPRPDMVTVEADETVRRALASALAAGYSRLPVVEGNLDDVVGVAYVKDLVRAEQEGRGDQPVRDHARPASFVPESKRLATLLPEMQERQSHLSIVVDEYGGTAGLVSLEDVLEELVGEIVDEFDVEEPPVEHLADGSVVVTGLMTVDEVDDLLGTELPQGAWDTIGGLLLDQAGHVPRQGEAVEVDGVVLVAQRVRGRRIDRVRIARRPGDDGVPPDSDGA
jgi:CBS domain containing-hemolysin-like protein